MKNFRAIESSPIPLYSQVRESVRERIIDGTYAPHTQLPAESEMSSIFCVSRITVRQALSDLHKEGVIFKVPGKGSFVSKTKAFQQLTQLEGFGEAMTRLGYQIYNIVVSHRTVLASAHLAQQLYVDPGTPLAEIKRIRHLNNAPVSLEITYLAQAIGERLEKEDLVSRDIFFILENDYGIELGHADLQIEAMLADAELAQALQVEAGTALLRLERLTYTAAGAPIDFEYLFFRCDAFQYRLQIARRNADETSPIRPLHRA